MIKHPEGTLTIWKEQGRYFAAVRYRRSKVTSKKNVDKHIHYIGEPTITTVVPRAPGVALLCIKDIQTPSWSRCLPLRHCPPLTWRYPSLYLYNTLCLYFCIATYVCCVNSFIENSKDQGVGASSLRHLDPVSKSLDYLWVLSRHSGCLVIVSLEIWCLVETQNIFIACITSQPYLFFCEVFIHFTWPFFDWFFYFGWV